MGNLVEICSLGKPQIYSPQPWDYNLVYSRRHEIIEHGAPLLQEILRGGESRYAKVVNKNSITLQIANSGIHKLGYNIDEDSSNLEVDLFTSPINIRLEGGRKIQNCDIPYGWRDMRKYQASLQRRFWAICNQFDEEVEKALRDGRL